MTITDEDIDVRKAATIKDEGLNKSFREGFEEGREVTDESKWIVLVAFVFEGTTINMRVYTYGKGDAERQHDIDEHLKQGPGARCDIIVTLADQLEAVTKKLTMRKHEDDDVIDAEVVSDTSTD
jgi:hypothetical protein